MNVAIMQPYFLPYLGYWQLLVASDVFVLYDNIQFTKKGWFHRNNILMYGEKKLFTLPLKQGSDYLNVVDRYLADDAAGAIKRILAQLKQSYRKAPYFDMAYPIIEKCFCYPQTNLFYFTEHSIQLLCQYLDIDCRIIRSSDISIDHNNAIGGVELYSDNSFKRSGVELYFLQSGLPAYQQFGNEFVPYLSVIDLMMFNSQYQLKDMLTDYSLIHK
jgi:hypothetical protein